MSNDPDLERDLERLMSRIDLPDNERWMPRPVTRAGRPAWAVAAAAAAVVIALAVGVASQSASDNAASRSPLISPPLLSSRPAPSPSPSGSVPPRGTAVVGPTGIILDFKEEGGAAADDHALGVVVHESSRIVVTEVGGQKHTFEATRGRLAFLAQHGALRGDLLAYIEVDYADLSSESSLRAVWHVMVANWRTGAITELDAIPSERATAPLSSIEYMPKVLTNGREVIWLRAPRVNGELASSDLMLWRDGKSTAVFRGDVSYALADDGRIAIVRLNCPPGSAVHLCPGGTRWELYLLEGSGFIPRLIAKRDVFGGAGGVGGPPAFAGNKIVWARLSTAAVKVTSVDIIDAQTGDTRTVTEEDCFWIGSTVREVVFSCPDSVLRVHPVAGLEGVTWSNEAGSRYFVADPHAIIGHHVDRGSVSWVIRPVPD